MESDKLQNILREMKHQDMPQLVVSDPTVIFYLTGLRIHPGERLLVLFIDPNGKCTLLINDLFRQSRDLPFEITYYNDVQDGVEILSRLIRPDLAAGIDKNWPARFLLRLQELLPGLICRCSSPVVDTVRQIKTPEEQERMRISSRINDSVMERLIGVIAQPHTELELNALVRQFYKDAGCQGVSFDPITAFAGNAADPHHEPDSSAGRFGDCAVLDIGGMKDDYASDMTRTVFLGAVSERQRQIYNIVLEANLRGIAAARPGNRMCDVDLAASNYIESQGFGAYFTHRTGHSIGLEDHEAGDVSAVNTALIRPGQCFSVEPGIYIPEEGIGVRIEDLVLITEDGCEVLNHYPKDLTVIPFH